jgi:hypothetical protein
MEPIVAMAKSLTLPLGTIKEESGACLALLETLSDLGGRRYRALLTVVDYPSRAKNS